MDYNVLFARHLRERTHEHLTTFIPAHLWGFLLLFFFFVSNKNYKQEHNESLSTPKLKLIICLAFKGLTQLQSQSVRAPACIHCCKSLEELKFYINSVKYAPPSPSLTQSCLSLCLSDKLRLCEQCSRDHHEEVSELDCLPWGSFSVVSVFTLDLSFMLFIACSTSSRLLFLSVSV